MKKYNRPEIEALALDTGDILVVSRDPGTQEALNEALGGGGALDSYNVASFGQQISDLNSKYTW